MGHYKRVKDRSKLVAEWDIGISGGYIRVYVWDKKEDIWGAIESEGDASWESGYAGCFIYVGRERLFGEIHLLKGLLGAGYVAHELTHALLALIEALELKDDEQIAELMEAMTRDFWRKFYKRFEVK